MLRFSRAVSIAAAAAGLWAGGMANLRHAVATPPLRDTEPDTWAATDALGRELPGYDVCGPPRPGRTVGIFYFLWMEGGRQVYDISRLLAETPANPRYGPLHAFHWWAEPHLGYYRSDDPFVIARHARMLSDAGVDVVVFDVTNAFTYDGTADAVFRTFEAIRAAGGRTPQIAFLAHSRAAQVVTRLHDRIYARGAHADFWFRWRGKPLMMAPDNGLAPGVAGFFTFRESWAWTNARGWFGNGQDKWPWLDNYPQQPGWHDAPDRPEAISVCVAQHPTTNIGRSFHDGHEPVSADQRPAEGLCFDEQWRRALDVNPEFIFITGWNEWIAQRFIRTERGGAGQFLGKPLRVGDTFFVDEYNQEYSRDIEPMRGGHTDNYYYQMVANIRRFKGVHPLPKPSPHTTIAINGNFGGWEDVRPEYRDDIGDISHRDHPGYGNTGPYRNSSGRNDIELAKVARDRTNLYFYARTHAPLTPRSDPHWMLLLIDADANPATGWQGYDFVVNRVNVRAGTTTVERYTGSGADWSWQRAAAAPLAVADRELHLALPRSLLGLDDAHSPLAFDFKWADNVPATPTPVDFIDQGDTAPNGRFRYQYRGSGHG